MNKGRAWAWFRESLFFFIYSTYIEYHIHSIVLVSREEIINKQTVLIFLRFDVWWEKDVKTRLYCYVVALHPAKRGG